MREQLRSLWRLQQLDIEISKLESRKQSIPQEIQQASQKIKLREEELAEKQKKKAELSTQRRKLEQDIEQAKDTSKRYKSQLLQVKTNKEYQALLHEINNEEAKISAYEEESIEILAKSDELSQDIEKMRIELEKRQEKFRNYENERQQELSQVTNALRLKEEERKNIATKINRALLARYEQVRKSRNGVGVARISESTCTGCNAVIPPQFTAEIKKGDKILTCEQCGRILVWEENVD